MRNPNRIIYFTAHLSHLWRTYFPDWRFGQLMSNFYNFYSNQDFFYQEDDKFIEMFEKFVFDQCVNPNPRDFTFINKE